MSMMKYKYNFVQGRKGFIWDAVFSCSHPCFQEVELKKAYEGDVGNGESFFAGKISLT